MFFSLSTAHVVCRIALSLAAPAETLQHHAHGVWPGSNLAVSHGRSLLELLTPSTCKATHKGLRSTLYWLHHQDVASMLRSGSPHGGVGVQEVSETPATEW